MFPLQEPFFVRKFQCVPDERLVELLEKSSAVAETLTLWVECYENASEVFTRRSQPP